MTYLLQSRRRTYIMSLLAVWLFQIGFASIIIIDALDAGDLDWGDVPDIKIAMTRFVCGMVLHVQCSGEIQNGLKIMKHSVNHYWKFSNYNTAFLAGFFQVIAMVLITLINYAVITIESTVIDVAKDFTALYIVAEFDNKFSLGPDEKPKQIITEQMYESIFEVQVTTSHDAAFEKSQELPDCIIFNRMKKRRENMIVDEAVEF
jgi:hypothetical protein